MAIAPGAVYPGQTITSDPGYPLGRARNVTVSGDGIGFPLEQTWVNDLFGLLQSLLIETGITPSGTADAVGASQYLTALQQMMGGTKTASAAVTANIASLGAAFAADWGPAKQLFLTPDARGRTIRSFVAGAVQRTKVITNFGAYTLVLEHNYGGGGEPILCPKGRSFYLAPGNSVVVIRSDGSPSWVVVGESAGPLTRWVAASRGAGVDQSANGPGWLPLPGDTTAMIGGGATRSLLNIPLDVVLEPGEAIYSISVRVDPANNGYGTTNRLNVMLIETDETTGNTYASAAVYASGDSAQWIPVTPASPIVVDPARSYSALVQSGLVPALDVVRGVEVSVL